MSRIIWGRFCAELSKDDGVGERERGGRGGGMLEVDQSTTIYV